MKKRLLLITSILILFLCFIITGCQKDSTTNQQSPWDQNSAESSSVTGLNTFNALNSLTDKTFSTDNLKSAGIGDCPTITANISQIPYVLTFDWGAGCVGTDGVTRKGKITVSLTGLMNVVGNVATFTFIDFYSGGNKITGVHTITYSGLNPGNNWPRFDVHTDAQILFPDNKSMTYLSDNTRLLAEGSTTLSLSDDVWRIEGTWSGKTRDGVNWTATCNNALVKKSTCDWFDSGTLVVTPEGGIARSINFGDGTCDNKATLTIGNQTTIVEM
jgi:hypothetical protein